MVLNEPPLTVCLVSAEEAAGLGRFITCFNHSVRLRSPIGGEGDVTQLESIVSFCAFQGDKLRPSPCCEKSCQMFYSSTPSLYRELVSTVCVGLS